MVVLGTVEAIVRKSYFVAVLGTTMLGSVGLRFAIVVRATVVTTATVFGSCLHSGLYSPLYSYPFTLYPFFSFSTSYLKIELVDNRFWIPRIELGLGYGLNRKDKKQKD